MNINAALVGDLLRLDPSRCSRSGPAWGAPGRPRSTKSALLALVLLSRPPAPARDAAGLARGDRRRLRCSRSTPTAPRSSGTARSTTSLAGSRRCRSGDAPATTRPGPTWTWLQTPLAVLHRDRHRGARVSRGARTPSSLPPRRGRGHRPPDHGQRLVDPYVCWSASARPGGIAAAARRAAAASTPELV